MGRETLTSENFRVNSFPQFTIDRARGRLYVTWADDRNGQYDTSGNSIKTNGDVFVTRSGNATHWSKAFQIGTLDDEVFPVIAASVGHIAVSFYTRTYDPSGIGLDYADVTSKRNLKHTTVTRITAQSEEPAVQFVGIGLVSGNILQGEFIGDHTAVAMGTDRVFHPSWTDFRGNPGLNVPNQDAYTQAIAAP